MAYDFLAEAEADLETHRDQVARWEKAIRDGTNQELNRQYFDEIQGLRSKCDAAEIALRTCKFAPAPEQGPKDRLEEALTDLRQAVDKFRRRFGPGND